MPGRATKVIASLLFLNDSCSAVKGAPHVEDDDDDDVDVIREPRLRHTNDVSEKCHIKPAFWSVIPFGQLHVFYEPRWLLLGQYNNHHIWQFLRPKNRTTMFVIPFVCLPCSFSN